MPTERPAVLPENEGVPEMTPPNPWVDYHHQVFEFALYPDNPQPSGHIDFGK
uniref:Uncharacterized protein n=1 Tax=viral metagenome TaxID=1070528 RepID=A0A6C0BN09_9ZZZZ